MKLLAVLATFILTFNAYADLRTKDSIAKASLTTFKVDEKSYLNKLNIKNGYVAINYTKKLIGVSLAYTPYCIPGSDCTRVIGLKEIKLSLDKTFTDDCGNIQYSGSKDDRPVDGLYEELTVVDTRQNHCMSTIYLHPTVVVYKTKRFNRLESEEVETKSYFYGSALELLFVTL